MEPALLVAVMMFVGGSVSDLRTRRVPNRYWVPFLAAAAFLAVDATWEALAWALGSSAFVYGLWWLGLFGGADAKALMVTSLLMPGVPALLEHRTVFAFDALVDATLLMVAAPLLFLAWNASRGDLRLPAALVGFRMDLDRARTRHYWPMQRGDGSTWRYLHRPGEDVDGVFAVLRRHDVTRPWVTPKVPFMVPLTLGVVMATWQGNLVLRVLASLLG